MSSSPSSRSLDPSNDLFAAETLFQNYCFILLLDNILSPQCFVLFHPLEDFLGGDLLFFHPVLFHPLVLLQLLLQERQASELDDVVLPNVEHIIMVSSK